MREAPGGTSTALPESTREGESVPSVEPFGMGRYRPQDRLDRSRAFYSIAYVTQRTEGGDERRKAGQECPSSPRDSSSSSFSVLPLLPRIVTIRPCGNVRSSSPLRTELRASIARAHRFQCARPRIIFSLYTITPQFAANVHQTFQLRARKPDIAH